MRVPVCCVDLSFRCLIDIWLRFDFFRFSALEYSFLVQCSNDGPPSEPCARKTDSRKTRRGRAECRDKRADLAGPGIGDYAELERILPQDYRSLLDPRETQLAIFAAKDYIEEHLCKELNLIRVVVPLIVDVQSGVNDLLDRDGSRTPIEFHISNDRDKNPIDAQVVQAATKWKRVALRQFDMKTGEGLLTDMRAVRKDYFLDHDHSAYVDQWGLGAGHIGRSAEPDVSPNRRGPDLESPQGGRTARSGALSPIENRPIPRSAR